MKKTLLLALAVSVALLLHAQQDSLQQYTGKYKFPEGSVVADIDVVITNGTLFANSVMGTSELRKTDTDVFEVVAYSGTATFKRDAAHKINAVQIIVGDLVLDGIKEEAPALCKQLFYYTQCLHFEVL